MLQHQSKAATRGFLGWIHRVAGQQRTHYGEHFVGAMRFEIWCYTTAEVTFPVLKPCSRSSTRPSPLKASGNLYRSLCTHGSAQETQSLARILSSLGAGSLRSCRIPSLRAVGRMGRGGNPEGCAASITRPPAPAGGTRAPTKQLLGLPKGEEEEAANTQLLPEGRGKEGHRHSVYQQELSTFSGFSYSHQKV